MRIGRCIRMANPSSYSVSWRYIVVKPSLSLMPLDQWDSLLPPKIEILSPRPRLPGEVWKPSQYRATEGFNFSNQYRQKLWLLERQIFSTFLTKYLNIGPELLSIKINSQLWSILDCDQFLIVIYSRLWSILDCDQFSKPEQGTPSNSSACPRKGLPRRHTAQNLFHEKPKYDLPLIICSISVYDHLELNAVIWFKISCSPDATRFSSTKASCFCKETMLNLCNC